MEKVKLPRDVSDALEEFYRCEESNRDIITAVLGKANSKSSHVLDVYFCKDDGHFNLLLEALVNGYEIEEQIDSVAIFAEKFGRKFS